MPVFGIVFGTGFGGVYRAGSGIMFVDVADVAASSRFVVSMRRLVSGALFRFVEIVADIAVSIDFDFAVNVAVSFSINFVELVFGLIFRLGVGFGLRLCLGFFLVFFVELRATYERVRCGLGLRFFMLGFRQLRRE